VQPDAVMLASTRICKKFAFDLHVTVRGKEYAENAIGETAHAPPPPRHPSWRVTPAANLRPGNVARVASSGEFGGKSSSSTDTFRRRNG